MKLLESQDIHCEAITDQRWRRWESKTSDFAPIQATTGNHRKLDPELAETKDEKKHVRENALPTGKTERDTTEGRADVGETPTAETLGSLARKVLSSSRHAESRELALASEARWTRKPFPKSRAFTPTSIASAVS